MMVSVHIANTVVPVSRRSSTVHLVCYVLFIVGPDQEMSECLGVLLQPVAVRLLLYVIVVLGHLIGLLVSHVRAWERRLPRCVLVVAILLNTVDLLL